jgi:uncharacterized membrane protein (UPF0127 family)
MCGGYFEAIRGYTIGIKNTNESKERAFMVRTSIVVWAGIILFLGLMFILPNPNRYFLWIPYSVLLPLGIIYKNSKQQRIRREK